MDYGMIGKIEKAKIYAEERERIRFDSFQVSFQGENNSEDSMHRSLDTGCRPDWRCMVDQDF